MPISGIDEPGAKPIARYSSDYIAGIPIKKRRFLLDLPASPSSPQVQSPQTVENKPMKKEPVKPPQEPVRTSVIPATSSSVISATKENMNDEECKKKNSISNTPRVKIEEPIRSVSSGSLAGVEREVKHMLAENTDDQINLGYEPKLNTKEALAPSNGSCKSESSTSLGNIELSLGPNNFRCDNIQKLDQIQEKTNLVSLNLSVGNKGKCSPQGQVDYNKCSSTDADLCANRAMWDLNTTMDEWEGSVNDAPACEDSEHTSNIAISTIIPSEPHKLDDSLNLRLTPYLDSCLSQGQSNLPATVNTDTVCPNLTMQKVMMPVPKSNVLDHNIVKSEPFVDMPNQNLTGNKDNFKKVLECRNLKSELIERCIPFLKSGIPTLSGPMLIKSELVVGGDQIANKAIGVTSNLSDKCLELSLTEQKTETSAVASGHSTYLKKSIYREEVTQKTCAAVAGSTYEIVSVCFGQEVNKSNVSGSKAATENIGISIDNGTGFGSDEEKINISADMVEEDSYSYDDESDGNHESIAAMDRVHREEDEYEDGEVREPVVPAATELNICEKGEEKDISGENDNLSGLTGDETTSYVEESECKTEYLGKDCNDHSAKLVDKVIDEKIYQGIDKDASLQESMAIEILTAGPEKKQPVKTIETEQLSDQATYKSQIAPVTLNHGVEVSIKEANLEGKNDSTTHIADISLNVNDAVKETSSGANRNRIINLKASNASSLYKTRYLPETSLPSRIAREKYSDSVIEGDKLYYPRGREEFYNDGSHKYSREGNRDQPFRNSRGNYNRGRGRSSSRQNTTCGDWSSDREFPPAYYNNDSTGSRFSRQKLGTTVNDKEFASDGYGVGPDDRAVGSGRGGKRPLNDETRPFRQFSSRGRSSGRRDGTAARGVQTVRRFPRNYSPRRIGEDGSEEFVGQRYNDNFTRCSPDDVVEPMLTRSQPSYEAREGRFVRENKNFVSMHGRGPTRIRSKSPTRQGPHSPAQWSSPRRRSPHAFNGLRRSGAIYRTRSPGSSLPAETVPRRHGSPLYMPCVAIDMDSGRELVTHRPVHVVPRNNRRPDILEPNERADTDEYFEGPGHPIQFQELEGEVNGDERRRYGERRGHARSFRPPMDSEGENFQYNAEDDSRSYRFRTEADSEFNVRENLRERDLDRRIKTRSGPGHAPRRMRNIEDDVDFRQGGQGWNDEEFDDTRLKRRRF